MAKKKTASGGMNRTERVAGTIFFLVYLLVMPLLATRIFDLLEVVLDTTINDSLRNVLYYYTLFAVTVLLFHSYLAHTSSRFLDNLNRALSTMLLGLLVFYGANELIFRVCNVLFNSRTNLNDMTFAAQVASRPAHDGADRRAARAVCGGGALPRPRVRVSQRKEQNIRLYPLLRAVRVFTRVDGGGVQLGLRLSHFDAAVPWCPALCFAWAYEHSGTLWTSILLHMLVNALSLFTIAS